MSTDGALSRTRWLPRLLGILLLLMGLALLAGGIKLSQLGGSLYYLIAGIGFALSGILHGQEDDLLVRYGAWFEQLVATREGDWMRIDGMRR